MTKKYQASEFSRQAQRFVNPIYIKNEMGGFYFSSTTTFIKYKEEYYCIFAAHALPPEVKTINFIGFLLTDGSFIALSEITKNYSICRESDLVICNTIAPFEHKNYFDLDVKSSTEFKEDTFGWIGFPKNKAKQQYHKTKSSANHILNDLSLLDDGIQKWENAKFLLLGIQFESKSEVEITGRFINKNVEYEHEGFKTNGYSLVGMSGGALFRTPKKIESEKPSLNDWFDFMGIGLRYKGTLVGGATKNLVVSLIDKLSSVNS